MIVTLLLTKSLLLTRVLVWYIVELLESDKQISKIFLNNKSLQQSHLKVEADDTLIQFETSASPPPSTGFSLVDMMKNFPEHRWSEFMLEFRKSQK